VGTFTFTREHISVYNARHAAFLNGSGSGLTTTDDSYYKIKFSCAPAERAVYFEEVALATPLTANQTPGVGFVRSARAQPSRSGRPPDRRCNQNCALTARSGKQTCQNQGPIESCHYPPTGTFPMDGSYRNDRQASPSAPLGKRTLACRYRSSGRPASFQTRNPSRSARSGSSTSGPKRKRRRASLPSSTSTP